MRAFIAIELSTDIQNLIASVQKQLEETHNHVKWVTPSNTHLTLKFLGDVNNIEQIQVKLKTIASHFPTITLETQGLGIFPSLKFPQIIWLGFKDNDQLLKLASAIEKSLGELGLTSETRAFKAHITIGRFKSKPDLLPMTNVHPKSLTQPVSSIALIQSTLTTHGPVYEVLSRYPLI